ncbi:MAG: S-layer homology domain-containing protein [Chloroflexi bacterium]|nr:S-layer homology domain-containing protein [Chloroflexota bacterium]
MNPSQKFWKRILSLLALTVVILSAVQPAADVGAQAQVQGQTPDGPQQIVLRPVKVGISTIHPTTPPVGTSPLIPSPTQNWLGIMNHENLLQPFGTGVLTNPPYMTGDIGPSHYIEAANNLFRIFSPTTGEKLWAEAISHLFQGFGGMCENNDDGSPMVVYDHLADRWVISQMARDAIYPGFEYHQCVAVSTTENPVDDPWYLYDYAITSPGVQMYSAPKLSMWSNGYYLALDEWQYDTINNKWNYVGQGVGVFERSKMLLGQHTAALIYLDVKSNSTLHRMLPADLDGYPPASDTPGLFVQMNDDNRGDTADQLEIWQLIPDWTNYIVAWGEAKTLAVSAFNSKFTCQNASPFNDCIPQPGVTSDKYLDVVSDRLMFRAQYRYLNGEGNLVLNQTVNVGSDKAGLRWYHLQTNAISGWEVADQGTYAPDSDNRWLGSAAMDASGNIAIGYSVASTSTYPSIRYTGRLAGDPAGTLPQGEGVIQAGTLAQTDTASSWGPLSSLSVDPVDQCSFWYTGEYIGNDMPEGFSGTPIVSWQTRVAKFDLGTGNCTTPTPITISGFVTDVVSGLPIPNAIVVTNTGYMAKTDTNGIYTLKGLPADMVTVTASATGHNSASQDATPPATDVNFVLSTSLDDISGASVIPGIPYMDNQDTTLATSAADDPLLTNACGLPASAKGSATLWYSFTPTASQLVYMDTYTSDFDTFIAVWTGARGNLTSVICNNDADGTKQSALTLNAVKDTTYYIEVGQATTTIPTGGNQRFHLATFSDVSGGHWAWRYVEGLFKAKVTGGCSTSPMAYCPGTTVTRDQMAVFLLRAEHGSGYNPPPATGVFADVPTNFWAAAWIEQLAAEGITGGCSVTPKLYCPSTPVTRDQMAVFLLRVKHIGTPGYTPPDPTGVFNDVPVDYWAARWIEQLAAEGITGGCGNDNFCPAFAVSRDQMAVFLVRTASLPLAP